MRQSLGTCRLLIAGASARAATHSARRAGIPVSLSVDYFGDRDLRDAADHWIPLLNDQEANWLDQVVSLAHATQTHYWMYTGAWENYPAWVDAVPLDLLGNGRRVIDQTRDPWQVARTLSGAGLPTAKLADLSQARRIRRCQRWLRKPIASGGGCRIEVCSDRLTLRHTAGFYLQERLVGESVAGVFVACDGEAAFLGATRQLSQADYGGPWPFGYAGSVGPVPLSIRQSRQWQQIGDVLADRIPLTGLFGVDAIDTGRELIVVEVNPRYPASAEVLERGGKVEPMLAHVRATLRAAQERGELPDRDSWQARRGWAGKLYVFAQSNGLASDQLCDWLTSQAEINRAWPLAADIPYPGTRFSRGAPITSLLAGPYPRANDVIDDLTRRAAMVQRLVC